MTDVISVSVRMSALLVKPIWKCLYIGTELIIQMFILKLSTKIGVFMHLSETATSGSHITGTWSCLRLLCVGCL